MASLSLTGYLFATDDKRLVLHGDNTIPFGNLGSEYWTRGVCRRVNSDKTECTIEINEKTKFEKSGSDSNMRDLDGCYVNVNVQIKKYTFFATSSVGPGQKIMGWRIVAKKIKRATPII